MTHYPHLQSIHLRSDTLHEDQHIKLSDCIYRRFIYYYYANIFCGLLTSMYETEGYIQTLSKWRIKQA